VTLARQELAHTASLFAQKLATQSQLDQAKKAVRDAEAAYRAGNIDERTFVDLATAVLIQRQNILALEQALIEQEVALATLTGAGMPVAAPERSRPHSWIEE